MTNHPIHRCAACSGTGAVESGKNNRYTGRQDRNKGHSRGCDKGRKQAKAQKAAALAPAPGEPKVNPVLGLPREVVELDKAVLRKEVEPPVHQSERYSIRELDHENDAWIVDKVREFRGKLTSRLRKSGNVGYAKVQVEGISKTEYYSHSNINRFDKLSDPFKKNLEEKGLLFKISMKPSKPTFAASEAVNLDGDSYLRDMDTEYKIINEIASSLRNNTDVNGSILLFTERKPCDSCIKVINGFMDKYRNIQIEVIHNGGEVLKPLKRDDG